MFKQLKKAFQKIISAIKSIAGILNGDDGSEDFKESIPSEEGRQLEWTNAQLAENGISVFWNKDPKEESTTQSQE